MAAAPLPADIATALRFGPQAQNAIRRSTYLNDALRTLGTEGGKNIQSYGELGSKLLAEAILQHGSRKADEATMGALKSQRDDETARVLAGLQPPPKSPTEAVQAPAVPQPAPQSPPQPAPQAPAVQSAPLPPAAPQAQVDPQALDALTRMIHSEASVDGAPGMAAAGHVAMNRLRSGFGGAKTLMDVVNAPHQFEGMTSARAQISPNDPAYQQARDVALKVITGEIPDPTGGAVNFFNPQLQAQLGRQQPAWAPAGGGQRIGHHVFYGGDPGAQQPPVQMAQAPAPPQDVQPFQVAANGPLQPGMMPSAPSPSGAGAAPVASPPQAAATGAQPNWPNWQPTPGELQWLQQGLADPQTHDQYVAKAREWQLKAQQPAEAVIQTIQGVPFYVSKVPGEGGQPVMIPVPDAAKSHTVTAAQAGIAAPPGTSYSIDPLGNTKEISKPASGQMAVSGPGEPYREQYIPGGQNDPFRPQAPQQGYVYAPGGGAQIPIPGGPADPYRPQAPQQGYAYGQGGAQVPIQGGPADPRNPQNIVAGTKDLRQEIAPIVGEAMKLKRNIDSVRTGFGQKNGSGDVAMVNGLQRLIDEGVVREGDVALQLKAQGIAGSIGGLQAFISSKGVFDPQTRAKVFNTANALYDGINDNYRSRVLGYRPIAENTFGSGVFDQYILPMDTQRQLGWAAGGPSQGAPPAPNPAVVAPTPGTREAAIAEARRRGLIK